SYYDDQATRLFDDSLRVASKNTKQKLEALLPDRIAVEEKEEHIAWANRLVEDLLDKDERCGHLRTRPAQTWNVLLGTSMFHCDQCWAYFQASVANGLFRLSAIEEFTCDRCQRYSTSLVPLVVRVSNFALRGGVCKRCSGELMPEHSGQGEDLR